MREIVFYRDVNGKNPIGEFLDSLPPKDAQKVTWTLRLVEELDVLPKTYCKKPVNTDEIWEIRKDTEDRLGEEKRMSDLNEYIEKRKQADPDFAKDYETEYENFKIGEMLKQARLERGLTQEELAARLHTKKTAISRIRRGYVTSASHRRPQPTSDRLLRQAPLLLCYAFRSAWITGSCEAATTAPCRAKRPAATQVMQDVILRNGAGLVCYSTE